MVDPKFILDFHVEYAIMFDVFRGHLLYGLSSYAIVVDIPQAQKGGVNNRGSTLLVTQLSEHHSNLFVKRRT